MMVSLRNALVGSSKKRPYDAEVEYLESTGTQWIDTGFTCSSDLGMRVKIALLELNNPTYPQFFGCFKHVGRDYYLFGGYDDGGNRYRVGSLDVAQDITVSSFPCYCDTMVNFMGNGKIIVNGAGQTKSGSYQYDAQTNGYKVMLFGGGDESGVASYNGRCRIYSAVITDGSSIVASFVPVRIGQVGYMYDKISGQLLGGQGTGNFTVGRDVAEPFWGLNITALQNNSTVIFKNTYGTPPAIQLDYSLDNGSTWHTYALGDTITLANMGDNVCFAASNGVTNTRFSTSYGYRSCIFTGSVKATGSLLSLVSKNKQDAMDATLDDYCFTRLFNTGTPVLMEAQFLLHNKNIADRHSYFNSIFRGQTHLTEITTDIPSWDPSSSSNNYHTWVYDITSFGVFVCPAALGTETTITRGTSNCPSDWTVVNEALP